MKVFHLLTLVFMSTAASEYAFISTKRSFLLHNGQESSILPFAPPDNRDRHVVEFLNDRVIVCDGGQSWTGPFHASCYQLSRNCSGWISHSREARYQAASSAVGGTMLVMGGYEYPDPNDPDNLQSSSSIERYDVKKGYWSMSTWQMPNQRNSPCAVALNADNIMLIGGNPDWNQAHVLNIQDGYWSRLPDTINSVGASGCTVGMLNGRRGVYVAGGFGSKTKSQFFDIEAEAWEALGDLNVGGDPVTMTSVNGIPLFFGEDSTVEMFDGSAWNIIDNNFLGDDLRGSASTTISEELGQWLSTVSSVDWSEDNTCGDGGDIDDGKLELSNIYQDHMVFQRAPNNPQIWGLGTPGRTVTVKVLDSLGNDVTTGSTEVFVEENEEFKVNIGSYDAGIGYTVIVRETFDRNNFLEVTLNDVAFGEVWLCSGQSNMELRIKDIRDSETEIENAETFENVRLLKPVRQTAKTPQSQVSGFYNSWSRPRREFLGSGDSFSAICLIYGEHLNDVLGVPIGLIDSTWGGTIIEAWSPPESLAYCGIDDDGIGDGQNHNEYLWNAMIHPFLRYSVKGVIWYQGEQNAGYPGEYEGHNRDLYSCSFPSMIENWRIRWSEATNGDVDRKFPFGFVQLAPFTNQRDHLAWPELRWHQTADYGYVPNEKMENVFMAVAADDDINLHPVNKRLPATRLAWAANNIVYGNPDIPFKGPQPAHISFKSTDRKRMVITYDSRIEEVTPEADRFMVCCLDTTEQCDKVKYGEGWEGINIVGSDDKTVELDASSVSCGSGYSSLAYLWLETPCSGEENCPVYANDGYRLPAAPWKMQIDREACSQDQAYDGDAIQIIETGENFLLRDSLVGCHKACVSHPSCQFYQWYDSLSQENSNKCFLLENQKNVANDEYLQYGTKICDKSPEKPLDIFFRTFGNGSGNGGRDNFSPAYVEALTTAIHAEDQFYAGLYGEAFSLIQSIWEKYPVGTSAWGPIMAEAGKHGEKHADPYPLLRMVEDMTSFRIKGPIPDFPKYNATISVVLAKADTVLPTGWDDFNLQGDGLKPGHGIKKVVGFNDHMVKDNHKVLHDSLITWISYIENAVAEGYIKFNLKVIEADDPVNCEFSLSEEGKLGKFKINCHYPFDGVMKNLPEDVLEDTKWFFMSYPYLPKELINYPDFNGLHDFTDINAAWGGTGGCCGGRVMWFGNEMGWTGENNDNLLGDFRYFTEIETRLWWATLQQHELFHFLFSLYPEFHLEDEGHQWFDHEKWPQDFKGLYEKDYFHEALYKRLLLADIPPYEKILKQNKMQTLQSGMNNWTPPASQPKPASSLEFLV